MAENFLVRHGEARGGLTDTGIKQAENTAFGLVYLRSKAILLSSDTPRATQTAEIIGEKLGIVVHESRRVNIAGNMPEVVEDLDEFLLTTLKKLNLQRSMNQPLIVVTHEPLIAIAKAIYSDDAIVRNGEIVEYVPGTWVNPEYNPAMADSLLDSI